MIVLYTKNLQKYLEIPGNGVGLPDFINIDALWHGNIFIHQRKKVLHLTHALTRFTIFIHGITKKDLINFNSMVLEHLQHHMIQEHIPLQDMQYINSLSDKSFSYFKKTDRKVTGTMNTMKKTYEHYCYSSQEIDDKIFSHQINHMLFKIDGEYQTPVELFKEFMHEARIVKSNIEFIGKK